MATIDDVVTNDHILEIANSIRRITRTSAPMTVPEMPDRLWQIRTTETKEVNISLSSPSPVVIGIFQTSVDHLFLALPKTNEDAIKLNRSRPEIELEYDTLTGELKMAYGNIQDEEITLVIADFLLPETEETRGYLIAQGGSGLIEPYNAQKPYQLGELFLYDKGDEDFVLAVTTVAHEAEEFNEENNKILASQVFNEIYKDLYQIANELEEAINNKVDKIDGYGLSKNDYTDTDAEKVSKIVIDGDGDKALLDDGSYGEVGKVDTVNSISPDENKNIEITGENIHLKDITTKTLTKGIEDIETNIGDIEFTLSTLAGLGGDLAAYNFGGATPTQQQLNDYALSQISSITDPNDIFNNTRVKNLFDGNVWRLTNTPNTEPPVFEWINVGPDMMAPATDLTYGSVKGNDNISFTNGLPTVLKSADADKLGGELPGHYAKASDVVDKITTGNVRRVYGVNASNEQETVEIETSPVQSSTKLLTSGAIYSSLDGKLDKLVDGNKRRVYGIDALNNQEVTEIETTPTQDSVKLITSGGVHSAVSGKEDKLPNAPEEDTADYYLGYDESGNKIAKKIVMSSGSPKSNIYFSNEDSDVVGYKKLSNKVDDALTTFEKTAQASTSPKLIEKFLFDLPAGVDTIDGGDWIAHIYGRVDHPENATRFLFKPFVYHEDGTEDYLFTEDAQTSPIKNTTFDWIEAMYTSEQIDILPTDRIGVEVHITTTRPSATKLEFRVGNGYASHVNLPLPFRHDDTRDKDGNPNYQHITLTEKQRLANIESGAEVNILDGLKLNSSDLTISNKKIDLSNKFVELSGSQDIKGVKTFEDNVNIGTASDSADLNIKGDLKVAGDIYQQGATYETHAEQVYTTSDEIILRDGAVGGLAIGESAGILIKKYDGTNDGVLKVDKDGIVRVGDAGDEQPLATREETPLDKGVGRWDNTTSKFVTETPDTAPTDSSTKLVESGGVKTALDNKATKLEIPQGYVPIRGFTVGTGEPNTSLEAISGSTKPTTIVVRNSQGQIISADATENNQTVTKKQLDNATFTKVYKSITELSVTALTVTPLELAQAMVNNSFLHAGITASGYPNLYPTDIGMTSLGNIEVSKLDGVSVSFKFSGKIADSTAEVIAFGTVRQNDTLNAWSGWKVVLDTQSTQTISGEKSFNLGTKFSINSSNNDFRAPLTTPSTASSAKRYLVGVINTGAYYTNVDTNVYMENGKLYSSGAEIADASIPLKVQLLNNSAGVYAAAIFDKGITGTAGGDGEGIGFYFRSRDTAGNMDYAGVLGGRLGVAASGSEIGEVLINPSYNGSDPYNQPGFRVRARTATIADSYITGKMYTNAGTSGTGGDVVPNIKVNNVAKGLMTVTTSGDTVSITFS